MCLHVHRMCICRASGDERSTLVWVDGSQVDPSLREFSLEYHLPSKLAGWRLVHAYQDFEDQRLLVFVSNTAEMS